MNTDTGNPFEAEIIQALEGLRQVPPRDPQKAARGREQFMSLVNASARSGHLTQRSISERAITTGPAKRLIGWIERITQSPFKKERFAMIPTLATILVSLALLFSGAGATVFAAQDSLPDDVLYPVKTWSEDLRLELASAPATQIELALNFANRRMAEIGGLTAEGLTVPAQVTERWQHQVEFALGLAAGQPEEALEPLLLRIREHLRTQDQLLTQLRQHQPDESTPLMARVQTRLREQLRLVEAGLEDPLGFQQHYRYGPGGKIDDAPQGGYGPGDGLKDGTGEQYGPGPGDSPEDGTGEQYGPGPGPGDGPEDGTSEQYGPGPGAGDGPEDGTGEQVGPGPGAGDGPGNEYGPGAGDCTEDCDHPEDGTGEQYGPGHDGDDHGNSSQSGGNGGKP